MRAWNVCNIYTSCIAQPRYCVCPLHALTTWCSAQLGKMRLMIPCRALTCSHLQCFDATLYIQMNEKKPTWVCPVCDKKAPYEHLIIDGWVTGTSPTISGAGSRMSKSIILISVNLFTFITGCYGSYDCGCNLCCNCRNSMRFGHLSDSVTKHGVCCMILIYSEIIPLQFSNIFNRNWVNRK